MSSQAERTLRSNKIALEKAQEALREYEDIFEKLQQPPYTIATVVDCDDEVVVLATRNGNVATAFPPKKLISHKDIFVGAQVFMSLDNPVIVGACKYNLGGITKKHYKKRRVKMEQIDKRLEKLKETTSDLKDRLSVVTEIVPLPWSHKGGGLLCYHGDTPIYGDHLQDAVLEMCIESVNIIPELIDIIDTISYEELCPRKKKK